METALEEGARVAHRWLLGVAWGLHGRKRACSCPACHRGLVQLLADTARLTASPPGATQQEARPS